MPCHRTKSGRWIGATLALMLVSSPLIGQTVEALSSAPAVEAEPARAASPAGPVVVIPVEGMIERGLVYVVRRGVREAMRQGAATVILDMDTPGGRLDAAEEIIDLIANLPMPTVTLVNPNAISAGAIIALGTDRIFMTPGSRIGDAMPIMMSPMGGVQEMNEGLEEKSVSFVAGLIRATAQRKGHDPMLAEAMVRRQLEYKIGDDVISKAGELLTLTNLEAERMVGTNDTRRPLLSSGTVANLEDLLARLGRAGAPVRRMEVTAAEGLARYIELFSALLLAGGLLCLYIEFKTPGFGLPGIAGIILLAIWFWGHHVAGLAGMGELLLFVLGGALLFVEIFVTPGFGLPGVAGLLLMCAAVIMGMVEHFPGGSLWPAPERLLEAFKVLGIALIGAAGGGVIAGRYLPRSAAFHALTLDASTSRAAGYQAAPARDNLVGRHGVAVSALKPGGIAEIDGRRQDVVAAGEYIDAGAAVVVTAVRGARIVVEPAERVNA